MVLHSKGSQRHVGSGHWVASVYFADGSENTQGRTFVAIVTYLQFRSLDLTASINDRYTGLINPGFFQGGAVTPVASQLAVTLAPWKLVSYDGMVVEETSDTVRLSTPAGQTTVISVMSQYIQNNAAIVETLATELTAYEQLPNLQYQVVFAYVAVPIGATSVDPSYINLVPANTVDQFGRSPFRGVLDDPSLLPASNNRVGDFYMVVVPSSSAPNLYAWDGAAWDVLTDSVEVAANLAAHRGNLFSNEKHLTDDQQQAVEGSSGTPVSATNRLVDSADPRVPTLSQTQALVGSTGSPGPSNLFVTQAFPLAVSNAVVFSTLPITNYALLPSASGPYYVGQQVQPSANQYFTFYHLTYNRELVNGYVPVTVSGVYLDAGLTQMLDPATNPNVDANGFFTGNLYIGWSISPAAGFRVVYSQRQTLGTVAPGSAQNVGPRDAQTSAETIAAIEAIKGRLFDSVPPAVETNIQLRQNVVNMKEYVSTVFHSDYVAFDFTKVANVPQFNGDFPPNVGVPANYSFLNTGLVAYSFDNATGVVTYASAVTLASVLVGHVFLDDAGVQYPIIAIGVNTVTITNRLGVIPAAISTTMTSTTSGYIQPDNNPRNINLANLACVVGRDRVVVRQINVLENEFHPATQNIAFEIGTPVVSPFFGEPRVRLYGNFQNKGAGGQSHVICQNIGILMITGFFTDLYLLVDSQSNSPLATVYVDGVQTGPVIDLSRAGLVADASTGQYDVNMNYVLVASNLTDLVPHTVEVRLSSAAGPFIFYGADLVRYNTSTTLVTSGRSFVQSDLFKSDVLATPSTPVPAPASRGQVVQRYINRSLLFVTSTQLLTDFDGASGLPSGTAVSGVNTFNVLSGLAKFSNFKAGDVVVLATAATSQVLLIQSIPSLGSIVFASNVIPSGAAVLYHMGSTNGSSVDPTQEFTRYYVSDFTVEQSGDFGLNFSAPGNKSFTLDDGTTSIAAQGVQYATTGINGVDYALNLVGPSSTLRFRAVCSRMDFLVANNTAITIYVSVDGSSAYPVIIQNTGMQRVPMVLNARYQTHEVVITNATGLLFAGVILHEPTLPSPIQGTLLATQNQVANYVNSLTTDGSYLPIGGVAIDPLTNGGVFVNGAGTGTPWAGVIDFNQNLAFGRYPSTSQQGSVFEYAFIGQGIELEYFAGPNRGQPRLFLNGTLVTTSNFPTATLIGVNSSTGVIDMYASTVTRKKVCLYGLTKGRYTLQVVVQTPRAKNALSSDYFVNITTVYELNIDGTLSVTPNRSFKHDFTFGLDTLRDERNFDSGAISLQQIPVQRTVVTPARAGVVSLSVSSTSVVVSFDSPMPQATFTVNVNFSNLVDLSPTLQPIMITAQSVTGFTARWTTPLPTTNYLLNYAAIVVT